MCVVGNDEIDKNEKGLIEIDPSIATVLESNEELIAKIYPDIEKLESVENSWLCDRAILTPKNEQATEIHSKIIKLIKSEEKNYFSINAGLNDDDKLHYPTEFLNSLEGPGLPQHELQLKIGAPIMLLRNLNPPTLCNGTRLRIKKMHKNLIEAEILTGNGAGETVYLPRIMIIPNNYPFQFKRIQFPIKLCYAMTINKAQGQTFKIAGIDLTCKCFAHGQFYVAYSRVSSPQNLFIFCPNGETENIVYKEILI